MSESPDLQALREELEAHRETVSVFQELNDLLEAGMSDTTRYHRVFVNLFALHCAALKGNDLAMAIEVADRIIRPEELEYFDGRLDHYTRQIEPRPEPHGPKLRVVGGADADQAS